MFLRPRLSGKAFPPISEAALKMKFLHLGICVVLAAAAFAAPALASSQKSTGAVPPIAACNPPPLHGGQFRPSDGSCSFW
ncbi:hypothetical protein CBOM_01824 [Ceraceosorus bombacis]|uniref:Uncharacterized protein n=1 Tax=Ceraceosorus bombacis TaxID=401625 RepID=A0A0N7L9J2_9BASI|nr:hypothetical protein CBOM_01824 [Ceraceosorus bombacis]